MVDQNALKKALEKQTIAGAALDVFIGEPPTDSKLLSLLNLMVTPHIGGNAKEAVEVIGRSTIDHLTSFFNDHPYVKRPKQVYLKNYFVCVEQHLCRPMKLKLC